MHHFSLIEKILNSLEREVKNKRNEEKVKEVKEIHINLGKDLEIKPQDLKFWLQEGLKKKEWAPLFENIKIKIKLVSGRECGMKILKK
jgi:Zn finger protein HypA/HybF involved in hydrogenase expression